MLERLKSLFSHQKEEEPFELSLGEIDRWIDEKEGSLRKRLEEIVRGSMRELKKDKNEILKSIEKLKKKKIEELDPKIKKAVESNKEELIQRVERFLGGFVVENVGITGFLGFSHDTVKRLDDLAAKSNRNILFLSRFLKDETKRVVDCIEKLSTDLKRVSVDLKSIKEDMREMEEMRKKVMILFTGLERQRGIEKEKDALKKELKLREEEKKGIMERIEMLLQSEDLRKLEELERKKSELMARKKSIETRIFNELSLIEKPLKRLVYSLEKPSETLKLYVEEPFTAIEKDKGFEELLSIMEDLRKFVEMESLGITDKRRNKILEQIYRIEKGSLKELYDKKVYIDKEIGRVKNEIEKIDVRFRLEEEEKNLRDVERRIREIKGEMRKLEKEKKGFAGDFGREIKALEESLNRFSERSITIRV
ncbi:MAG: hypothetical protein DRP11_02875 [Candidatus Aenigmatarchaeota archaeon]|nr:MAG: hypothetical protein DRP11_02875 [Candidatus Aenigmarchaeota archaeon]